MGGYGLRTPPLQRVTFDAGKATSFIRGMALPATARPPASAECARWGGSWGPGRSTGLDRSCLSGCFRSPGCSRAGTRALHSAARGCSDRGSRLAAWGTRAPQAVCRLKQPDKQETAMWLGTIFTRCEPHSVGARGAPARSGASGPRERRAGVPSARTVHAGVGAGARGGAPV
jgi:hypothetical protein